MGGDIKSLTEPGKINPGKTKLDIFIRDIQSWDPRARQRVEKSASDTTRWDHDDCDIFVPLLGEESVRQAVQKQGGARQAISNQGLQNAYVGFNNFTYLTIDRLKRNIDEAKEKPGSTEVKESTQETVERMSHLLKVFIRLDAYLDKRSEHSATLTRFGDREYDALAVNDTSRTVRTFVEEQRAFIGGLAKKWGMGQLWAQCISKAGGEYPNPDFAKKQENAIADFNKQLGAMMQRVYEAKGAEGLLKDFQDVQEENSKKTGSEDISLDIKGQLSKPVTKSEARKEATTSSKYEDGVLKGKVEEINYLNNRIAATENKSIAEIKAHREARLDQLIKKIQKGDYGNINKEDDIEILDREISRLKQDLDKKKQGEEDKNSEAEKKKKAEATAKAKADEEEEAVIAAKRKEEAERG